MQSIQLPPLETLWGPVKSDSYDCRSFERLEWVGYLDLVEAAGLMVLESESVGSYQGEEYVLVRDLESTKFGVLNYGYGSCSGCDLLEAAKSVKDLEDIRDGFRNAVELFDSPKDLLARIEDPKWIDDFYDKPDNFAKLCRNKLVELGRI